ncbi:MAG: TraB/GumN family protein [Alphaproteobacteria bacterium]
MRFMSAVLVGLAVWMGFGWSGIVPSKPAPARAEGVRPALTTPAQPAIWRVAKDGQQGWLFGTMHALPDVTWKTATIEGAIREADVFVFELEIDRVDLSRVRELVLKYGFIEDGRTLPDIVNARRWAQVADLAAGLGLARDEIAALLPMRPWYASLYLTNRFFSNEGFAAGRGVEESLLADLRAGNRRTMSLETAEQQLAFLDGLSEPIQVAMLEATVRDLREKPDIARDMLRHWAGGDTQQLADLLNDALKDYPEAYDALLVARNRAWIPAIMDLMASGQTIFVAVGAGHLVGRDSVVALLEAQGYQVNRAY